MSNENTKPRELWILTASAHLPINVVDSQIKAEEIIGMTKRSNGPSAIHVVEYSALENYKDALRCMQQIIKSNGSMSYEEFKTNLAGCNLSAEDL